MVKSMSLILLQYRKAILQADELEKIASEMRALAENDFNTTLSAISNNWVSENSKEFIRKGHILQKKISDNANALEKTAATIRSIAERTKIADENARSIALSSEGPNGC